MEWTSPDVNGHRRAMFEGMEVVVYRTPGRRRGWTVEVGGEPDEGLTGCSPRVGRSWESARGLVEAAVRARVRRPAGWASWASPDGRRGA